MAPAAFTREGDKFVGGIVGVSGVGPSRVAERRAGLVARGDPDFIFVDELGGDPSATKYTLSLERSRPVFLGLIWTGRAAIDETTDGDEAAKERERSSPRCSLRRRSRTRCQRGRNSLDGANPCTPLGPASHAPSRFVMFHERCVYSLIVLRKARGARGCVVPGPPPRDSRLNRTG